MHINGQSWVCGDCGARDVNEEATGFQRFAGHINDAGIYLKEKLVDAAGESIKGFVDERRTQYANYQARREEKIIDQLRTTLHVSKRLKLETLRKILRMGRREFLKKIPGWAQEFKFTIDEPYISVQGGDIDAFVSSIDVEFTRWEAKESSKDGKI